MDVLLHVLQLEKAGQSALFEIECFLFEGLAALPALDYSLCGFTLPTGFPAPLFLAASGHGALGLCPKRLDGLLCTRKALGQATFHERKHHTTWFRKFFAGLLRHRGDISLANTEEPRR